MTIRLSSSHISHHHQHSAIPLTKTAGSTNAIIANTSTRNNNRKSHNRVPKRILLCFEVPPFLVRISIGRSTPATKSILLLYHRRGFVHTNGPTTTTQQKPFRSKRDLSTIFNKTMPGILMNSMSRRRQQPSSVAKKMSGNYPRLPRDAAVCASRHSGGSTSSAESSMLPTLPPANQAMRPVESWGHFIEFESD